MEQQDMTTEFFGNPIHIYTRAQAIADGVLVDVGELARDAGFRLPVALTRTTWVDCVEWTDADSRRQVFQDETGRLWDVLFMAAQAARRGQGDRLKYQLYRVPRGGWTTRPRLVSA